MVPMKTSHFPLSKELYASITGAIIDEYKQQVEKQEQTQDQSQEQTQTEGASEAAPAPKKGRSR